MSFQSFCCDERMHNQLSTTIPAHLTPLQQQHGNLPLLPPRRPATPLHLPSEQGLHSLAQVNLTL